MKKKNSGQKVWFGEYKASSDQRERGGLELDGQADGSRVLIKTLLMEGVKFIMSMFRNWKSMKLAARRYIPLNHYKNYLQSYKNNLSAKFFQLIETTKVPKQPKSNSYNCFLSQTFILRFYIKKKNFLKYISDIFTHTCNHF